MFDIYQSPVDEDGDRDDEAAGEYLDGLMNAFVESAEGQAFVSQWGSVGWTSTFLEYGLSYLGEIPPEMSRHSVEEIVFDIFPRKVSAEPDTAPQAIAELTSFWRFLQRESGLAGAAEILQRLDGAEDELEAELGDPANFGMAKRMVTQAKTGRLRHEHSGGAGPVHGRSTRQLNQQRLRNRHAAHRPWRVHRQAFTKPAPRTSTGAAPADETREKELTMALTPA